MSFFSPCLRSLPSALPFSFNSSFPCSFTDPSHSGKFGCDVRMAADSTMLRMVNLLIALSLGVHRAQLEQRMGLTWPRPFLLRPL